jgi:hypothetical protein
MEKLSNSGKLHVFVSTLTKGQVYNQANCGHMQVGRHPAGGFGRASRKSHPELLIVRH